MAKKSQVYRALRAPKFSTRKYHRCPLCGRRRAYLSKFNMCRICFRDLSLRGDIPGVTKASW